MTRSGTRSAPAPQAAAKKDNINLKYSNDPDATKQAALIQNAVDSKVDGIATTMATPNALKSAVGRGRRGQDPGRGVQLRYRPVRLTRAR